MSGAKDSTSIVNPSHPAATVQTTTGTRSLFNGRARVPATTLPERIGSSQGGAWARRLRRSRRAVDPETEIALSRTGRTTMPSRRRRTPSSAERDWRWHPAERQHGSGWPDQRRPSGRVIPRPGRRRSAGAIYGPRSSDHQHIKSTSAQPDLCPVPRRDDRKWRSSVWHRTSAPTISTFAMGASLGSTNSVPFRFWIVASTTQAPSFSA